jgi:intracellular sulfur oxidation DsrE/DsrF family protein
MTSRRRWLTGLLSVGAGVMAASSVTAETVVEQDAVARFPGDPTDHNIVYQFNKAEADYQRAVLFSVGEMLRQYNDNVSVVVTAFGPGIHILAKKPSRPVSDEIKQRVKSLAEYGVKFHACGNTMQALGWTADDMLPFAEVIKVGAADIMELQEQGYSYISW